jgi:hypothetical protein
MSFVKKLTKRFWQTGYLFQGFLEGDLFWGKFRIFVLVGMIAVFLLMIIITETVVLSIASHLTVSEIPIIGSSVPEIINYIYTAILHSLRFILVPLSAFTIAMLVGANYVQDIYELENYWVGMRYLLACIFGIGYPRLQIDNGRKMVKPDEVNTLATIGGPGYVMIRPGNAVLFERLTHPSNVLAAGWHFISRFESIKEIVDLNDQQGYIEKATAMSKDGILVSVNDVHFRYRLWGNRKEGGGTGRSPENPYPFSVQSIYSQVYNRAVRADGLATWNAAVQLVVEGAILDFIRGNQVDAVTAPANGTDDPRKKIRQKLLSADTRLRLKEIGAELIWFDTGHFSLEKPIEDQRIETWGAEWVGDAKVIQAYGSSQRQIFQELGRAEAQAELLMSIVHSMDNLEIPEDQRNQAVSNMFLIRTAQVLESMSKVYDTEDQSPSNEDTSGNKTGS